MDTNYAEIYAKARMTTVAAKIKEAGGVINDHTGKMERVDGLAYTTEGKICPMVKGTGVCANPINMKDGVYHWSTWSTRGLNVWWNSAETLEHAIERTHKESLVAIKKGYAMPYIACLEIEW